MATVYDGLPMDTRMKLPEVPEAPLDERTAHQLALQYWCFLGESPYTQRELMKYLQADAVCLSQDEWIRFGVQSVPDFIVIGRHGCNLPWLRQQVPQWLNHPRYLPQDAAWDWLENGVDWYDDPTELKGLVPQYPGLRLLTELSAPEFPWPLPQWRLRTADEFRIFDSSGRQEVSELRQTGYTSQLPRRERWDILTTTAIPQLGIEHVVGMIAWYLQRHNPERYARACAEWSWDLQRLRETYYRNQFRWPETKC